MGSRKTNQNTPASATFTQEFESELHTARGRLLRRRFLWYCGALGTLAVVNFLGAMIALMVGVEGVSPVQLPQQFIQALLFFGPFLYILKSNREQSRTSIVRLVFWIIVSIGLVQLGASFASGLVQLGASFASADQINEAFKEGNGFSEWIGPAPLWLLALLVMHIMASLFIPWTPVEAIKPLVPLLLLYAVLEAASSNPVLIKAVSISLAPLVGAPGVLISWMRYSRFRDRFHHRMLRSRYSEIRRELTDARMIHESLFPKPIETGSVRFCFEYEPMRQIGGDYLFAYSFPGLGDGDDPPEPLSLVLLDVTGHGIAAALTVNRLHGELERLFAEEPDISPGDVLSALNRYVHLTLARHSVYATALCLRVDSNLDLLEWASGGHPPAFVRTVDGNLDQLNSTAYVLGATHGDDFKSNQRSMPFTSGDSLLAYTDGAVEARDELGDMLRVEGLQRFLAGQRSVEASELASRVIEYVREHRFGPAADDTLIVDVYRPLG